LHTGINGGVCLAAIIAYPFVMYVDGGWRWANLTFSLMPCVQLALHGYVLESPLWKQPAERDEAAAAADAEDDDLKPSWWDLREPLAVGATLAALQPLTGINIFTSYSTGQHKRAKFPTSKAPISASFHSFWLIFGRAIIPRNGLEAWMLFPERARAEHSR
jgi:hypothetical protein